MNSIPAETQRRMEERLTALEEVIPAFRDAIAALATQDENICEHLRGIEARLRAVERATPLVRPKKSRPIRSNAPKRGSGRG
jgi:hypothetical protein